MATWLIILICVTVSFTAGAGFGYYTRCKEEETE